MDILKEFLDYHCENPHNVNFKMIVAMEDREETLKAMHEISELLNTGLTPEGILELKERDTEKSVCHYHEEEKFRAYCQTCKRYLGIDFKEGYRGPKNTFCPGCGQRVKWED